MAVRLPNCQRFCSKYPQYQVPRIAFMAGSISLGAVASSAFINRIRVSGKSPSIWLVSTMRFAIALIASGKALSIKAESMMGLSSSTAVFGKPFWIASSTFFHIATRFGGIGDCEEAFSAKENTARDVDQTISHDCRRNMFVPDFRRG